MSEINDLRDWQARLQDLQVRYTAAIDNDQLEAWPEFFTEDCHYRITTKADFDEALPLGIIYATSRAMLRDRVTSLREANIYEDQGYRHVINPPLITESTNEGLRSETNFMVVRTRHDGDMLLFAAGRYLDLVVFNGTTSQFAEKTVVVDSNKIDTLLAIPL